MIVQQGLDFILKHFETGFPRTISTLYTNHRQVEVNSTQDALQHFQKSDYKDCRISAFGREEIEQERPNLIFVDLDDRTALNETLSLFYKTIGGIPTILDTGGGYAIIQPIQMISMKEQRHEGKIIEEPGKKFLQFAEKYLTNSRCDPGNHPSLRSCLIRIPGSYNSKYGEKQLQVNIIQEWDGKRVDVRNLPFKKYLDKIENIPKKNYLNNSIPGTISYIENLLKSELMEGRKRACALILCPYLVNVKKLSIDEAEKILNNYFKGYIPKSTIRYNLKTVLKKGILPYNLKNMKENDPELFSIVTTVGRIQ
jgi:hypothetical protein